MKINTVLSTHGLSCGYNKLAVVRNLDLHVDAGEVVVLLGPNGVGKTTTLLTLAGVLPALSGTVELNGRVTAEPLHRRVNRGMKLVTDDKAIFSTLSVRDNLRLGRGSIEGAIGYFPELRNLLSRSAGLLSGGEQQMLTVGRALAARPKVLLADELSLGLAPRVVQRLLTTIRHAADEGSGILLVEQHARLALGVADRGYVLQNGEIALSGSGLELVDRIGEIESSYLGEPKRSSST